MDGHNAFIEKGLPSALRNNGAGLGTDYLTRASGYRIMAHNAGKAEGARSSSPFRSASASKVSERGKAYRAKSKRSLEYLERTGKRQRVPSGVAKSGHDAFLSKSSYAASARGMTGLTRTAVGQARKGKLARLSEKEAAGRRARIADDAAKQKGLLGASLDSRPTVGRRRKTAWDLGFNSVGKSYMPGVGYKAAKDLSHLERKVIGAKASGKTIRLKTKSGGVKEVKAQPNRMKNAPSAKGRQIWPGVQTKRGTLTKVVASRQQTGLHPGGGQSVEGFSMPDGRGGGKVYIHDDADFKVTHKHEMAHIAPRRNPVRFQERAKDPTRKGREEGRADFIARGKKTPGSYPGDQKFQQGYNEVQGKMAAAKPSPKRRGFLRRQS